MADMLPICRPQPNWMPKKPKLMFQICQKLKRGFVESEFMCLRGYGIDFTGRGKDI